MDYGLISQIIGTINPKFFPTAQVHKGGYVERARINYNNEIFNKRAQISYITDQITLRDRVNFGRANVPHQSVFYGSVISPEIVLPRAVTYFETTTRAEELSKSGPFKEYFTVGRWRVKETFEVVEIIYGNMYVGNSEYVRMSIDNQKHNLENAVEELKKERGQDFTTHFEQQAKLFCNEFAKTDISDPDDYKISAAYSNHIWDKTPYKGITYPSVASGYKGQNLALSPIIVDQFLELESVYLCVCQKNHEENPIVKIIEIVDPSDITKDHFLWKNKFVL